MVCRNCFSWPSSVSLLQRRHETREQRLERLARDKTEKYKQLEKQKMEQVCSRQSNPCSCSAVAYIVITGPFFLPSILPSFPRCILPGVGGAENLLLCAQCVRQRGEEGGRGPHSAAQSNAGGGAIVCGSGTPRGGAEEAAAAENGDGAGQSPLQAGGGWCSVRTIGFIPLSPHS